MDKREKANIVLHVGLHKTGTTFLQLRVFPNMKGVHLVVHPKIFLLKLDENRVNLISDESLTGRPHYLIGNEGKRFADALYSLFPNARIIIGFREVNSWFESIYKQYVYRGGTISRSKFRSLMDKSFLDFNSYLENFKHFREIHIYQYEELVKNPDNVIKKMSDFIGVPMPEYTLVRDNVSLSSSQTNVLRRLNYFVSTPDHTGLVPHFLWRRFIDLARFGKDAKMLKEFKPFKRW